MKLEDQVCNLDLAKHKAREGKCEHHFQLGYDIECPSVCRKCGEFQPEIE